MLIQTGVKIILALLNFQTVLTGRKFAEDLIFIGIIIGRIEAKRCANRSRNMNERKGHWIDPCVGRFQFRFNWDFVRIGITKKKTGGLYGSSENTEQQMDTLLIDKNGIGMK